MCDYQSAIGRKVVLLNSIYLWQHRGNTKHSDGMEMKLRTNRKNGRPRFDSGTGGTTVSCHDISYVVRTKIDGKYGMKTILNKIRFVAFVSHLHKLFLFVTYVLKSNLKVTQGNIKEYTQI